VDFVFLFRGTIIYSNLTFKNSSLLQSKNGERWQTSATFPAQIYEPERFGLFAAFHEEATVKYLMFYVNYLFVICD